MMLESSIPTEAIPEWLTSHAFTREFKSDGSRHYTILRDKLYRVAKKVQTRLKTERTGEPRFGVTLVEVYFEDDSYSIGFLVENPDISEHYVRRGPSKDLVEAADEFRKSHSKVEERDGFLWTTEKRQWRDPQQLVDSVLEDNPIQGLERVIKTSSVSRKILNVLYRYILPIESSFLEKIARVKDGNLEIPR